MRAALRTYVSRKHLATPERLDELLDRGNELLGQMDDHLQANEWLVGNRPTIADISLYAYTHSAETKGGFDLQGFPAVQNWLDCFAALPGYVGLAEIPE